MSQVTQFLRETHPELSDVSDEDLQAFASEVFPGLVRAEKGETLRSELREQEKKGGFTRWVAEDKPIIPDMLYPPGDPRSIENVLGAGPDSPIATGIASAIRVPFQAVSEISRPSMLPVLPLAAVPLAREAMGFYFGGQALGAGAGEVVEGIKQGDPEMIGRGAGTFGMGTAIGAPTAKSTFTRMADRYVPARALAKAITEAPLDVPVRSPVPVVTEIQPPTERIFFGPRGRVFPESMLPQTAEALQKAPTLKGKQDALQISEAEKVHGGVPEQPRQDVRQVPAPESAERVSPSGVREEAKIQIADIPQNAVGVTLRHPDGRSIIASPDAFKPGGWRLTEFDKEGNPGKHAFFGSRDAALANALGLFKGGGKGRAFFGEGFEITEVGRSEKAPVPRPTLEQDIARYQEINRLAEELPMESPEMDAIRVELEEIKNRHGGMPPTDVGTRPPVAEQPAIQGMGGAVPSEFTPPPASAMGLKNAAIDAERTRRGLEPLIAPLRRGREAAFDEAMARMDRDPGLQDRLVQEIIDKPRTISDWEHMALLQREIDLRNEYNKATREAARAYDEGRFEDAQNMQAVVQDWSNKMSDLETAMGRGGVGTLMSRAFNIRKTLMKEDFSLASLELQKRADNRGRPLTVEERAELVKVADTYQKRAAELEARLAKVEAERVAKGTETALETARKEAKPRTSGGERKGRPAKTTVKQLSDIKTKLGKAVADKQFVKVTGLVQELARLFVEMGVNARGPLIDAVHGVLKEFLPNMTRRDVMDAISGYGRFKQLTKDEVSVRLRDLKGQMQQVAKLEDMQAKQPPLKTGVERRIPSREESHLIKQVNEMKRKFQVPVSDPATQLKSPLDTLKTRMRNQMAEYEEMLRDEVYTLKKKQPPIELDAEALQLRTELESIKQKWNEARLEDQIKNRDMAQRLWAMTRETSGLVRAWLSSMEMSGLGRQARFMLYSHPIKTLKAVPKAFKAVGSEAARIKIDLGIRLRDTYPLMQQGKLYISEHSVPLSRMEEAFMTRLADRVGFTVKGVDIRPIAMSERGYTTLLNLVRADVFDAKIARLSRYGEVTPEQALAIGNFVNVFTGRGTIKMMERAAGDLNAIFWAPRFQISRFQFLLGQPLWKGAKGTRRLIAGEYARAFGGLAIYYALISMWLGDEVEIGTDPGSTDFGKIRIGETRIDPLAGIQQAAVYLTRSIMGEKTTQTGKRIPIRGPNVPYGGEKWPELTTKYLRTKLHPVPAGATDILTQEDVIGQPVTWQSMLRKYAVPITYQDTLQLMEDQGIPRGLALMVLAFFGEGIQTYGEQKK